MKKVAIHIVLGFLIPCLALSQNADSLKKTTPPGKPKSYKEIINEKAVTYRGLFNIHKIDERYFFEIPDSLFNKDILVVNRITQAAASSRFAQGSFGYAGDEIGENIIEFFRGPGNKIFIKKMSYREISRDSTENGMYRSVLNSNLQPIVASFDIKAFSPDSSGVVIDLTDYISGDNDIFFFNTSVKTAAGLGPMQPDKSYINSIRSFPVNIEIHTVKTYGTAGGSVYTFELNSSLVLLPKQPMKSRYVDARVGYFGSSYLDFDSPKGVEVTNMITRWRLEPKVDDIEKYKKGELVEPKKPIIFYIDPATPQKWIPYLMQGVNDWQKAFEKAGFKNAIYALDAPTNDPDWSLEDARHNAIVYKASYMANASGPNIHDPRTGEILESHINWYHNVMSIIHDWYMIQAGPSDPKARKMEFDDSLMGELIRFVSSHEVGHTLGLMHNFGASSTIPVENLRDRKWVEENGFCPSIMDYARFNYVAQPEDSVSEKGLFPRIGAYDMWAIEWGYRLFPDLKTPEEEKAVLNQWVIAKLNEDDRLWFGSEYKTTDPRCQSEDLGDDAIKASSYGIKNLKLITPKIVEWTKEPHADYISLKRINDELINQYQLYIFHVVKNIGGVMVTLKTREQKGRVLEFTSKEKQKESIQFLQRELFNTPQWILNQSIYSLVGGSGIYGLMNIQAKTLQEVLSYKTFTNLLLFEINHPDKAYTPSNLFNDIEEGIFEELKNKKPIDIYRRNLQKIYSQRLIALLHPENKKTDDDILYGTANINADIISIIKGHVGKLVSEINTTLPEYKDEMTKLHLRDVRDRLIKALTDKPEHVDSPAPSKKEFSLFENNDDNRIALFEY